MATKTIRVYILVLDNDDHILIDNTGRQIHIGYCEEDLPPIEVRWINANHYPCVNCKYKNNATYPNTKIHKVQQLSKSYSHNQKQGQWLGKGRRHSGFAEIIGTCADFDEQT